MNPLRIATVFLLLTLSCAGQPAPAVTPPPTQVERYEVKEAPFGYLGIKHATISISFLRLVTFRSAIKRLQVDEFYSDSPAVKAGMKAHDCITGLNGTPINQWSVGGLKTFGETVEVGQKINVEIFRPSENRTFTAEVTVTTSRK